MPFPSFPTVGGDNNAWGTKLNAVLTFFQAVFNSDGTLKTASLDSTIGTAAALDVDTDGTLTADSDSKVASQKAVKTYADAAKSAAESASIPSSYLDTDGTMAADSDAKVASQ